MESSSIIVVLLVIIVAVLVQGEEYDRYHYPNPQEDFYECGRGDKKSYLCDPDQILNPGEADQLDSQIERVMNETKCPCSHESCSTRKYFKGYKIAVALINKMPEDVDMQRKGEDDLTHALDKARLFAYTLLQRWKFGKCGEDLIIFYSRADNVLYTMTGEESEKKLKNEVVGTISMEGRGKFGSNNFDGLLYLITKYRDVLSGKYIQRSHDRPKTAALTDGSALTFASTTFVILSTLLAAVLAL